MRERSSVMREAIIHLFSSHQTIEELIFPTYEKKIISHGRLAANIDDWWEQKNS